MNKILLSTLCLILAPTLACASGFYSSISLSRGEAKIHDPEFINAIVFGLSEIDTIYGMGVAFGYDFSSDKLPLRSEIEYHYHGKFEVDDPSNQFEIDYQTLLVNVKYDFYAKKKFASFLLGGAGGARVKNIYKSNHPLWSGFVRPTNNTKYNFTWNLGGGFSYKISEQLIVEIAYRYLDVGSAESESEDGQTHITADCSIEELVTALRFNF